MTETARKAGSFSESGAICCERLKDLFLATAPESPPKSESKRGPRRRVTAKMSGRILFCNLGGTVELCFIPYIWDEVFFVFIPERKDLLW